MTTFDALSRHGNGVEVARLEDFAMKNVEAELGRFAAILALGLLTAAIAGSFCSAAAETAREACTHDAFRLCSDAMPDVAKTKACLARHRAHLSPLCRSAFPAGSTRRHRRRHG
jgi:hypothetical protein